MKRHFDNNTYSTDFQEEKSIFLTNKYAFNTVNCGVVTSVLSQEIIFHEKLSIVFANLRV